MAYVLTSRGQLVDLTGGYATLNQNVITFTLAGGGSLQNTYSSNDAANNEMNGIAAIVGAKVSSGPTITSVSPSVMAVAGGTLLVNGLNFSSNTPAIKLVNYGTGFLSLTTTYVSSTQLSCVVPATSTALYSVVYSDSDGGSYTAPNFFVTT